MVFDAKKHYEQNKERILAKNKARRQTDKFKATARAAFKVRYYQNHERHLEKQRARYHKNKAKHNERNKAYNKTHREAIRLSEEKYRLLHPDSTRKTRRESARRRRLLHPEKFKAKTGTTPNTAFSWSNEMLSTLADKRSLTPLELLILAEETGDFSWNNDES